MCLVRTLAGGDVTEEWLIPAQAVMEALFSSLCGAEVISSHIVWGAVSKGNLDASGSALCVEWNSIRDKYDLGYGGLG